MILVMTVYPGFGGQRFMPEELDKIRRLRRRANASGNSILIEADGGIDPSNAGLLAAAGCDVLVAGSSVFGKDDPAEACRILSEAAHSGIRGII